jgi:hypothetical protein
MHCCSTKTIFVFTILPAAKLKKKECAGGEMEVVLGKKMYSFFSS